MTPPNRRPSAEGPALTALAPIERYRAAIVGELRAAVEARRGPPFSLMPYHLGWEDRAGNALESRGGKLLRPALCLLACEAAGGDWRQALPAAVALELVHNFTLIHDDIEDASARRHGRETLWRVWGEAQAINVGDGMFALAQVTLLGLEARGFPAARVVQAARLLGEATIRLCEGQHLDLLAAERPSVSEEEYLRMIEGKTAALLSASCGIGAVLGGADDQTMAALSEFGRRLGLAFQVRDDFLGIWGEPAATGKPVGDDLRAGKRSYPIVVGIQHASERDGERLAAAIGRPGLTDAEVAELCDLLERLGVRRQCERAAGAHAEAAVAALRGLPLDTDRIRELERLARFAAERDG